MTLWKNLQTLAIAICLVSPVAVYAAEEASSIQNAAQAQHLENLAKSSFSEEDMEQARIAAAGEAKTNIDTLVNDYAAGVVDQIASDQAYQEVKQLSRDHAINSVDTEFLNLDARAVFNADKLVEEKANDYASDFGSESTPEYQEAYAAAMVRFNDPSFHNAWDTAYEEVIRTALGDDEFSKWEMDYNSTYDRSTGGGEDWEDFWHTVYKSAEKQAIDDGALQAAKDYAYARATNLNFPNAYQAEYKKALEAAVAGIADERLRQIYEMRYVRKMGLGLIAKEVGTKPYNIGLGNTWKHRVGPSIDDEIIPPGPVGLEEMSLEKEIAQATLRNTKTGWDKGHGATTNQKGKSKKRVGLTEPSLEARSAIAETDGGYEKGSNGNSNSSAGASKSNKSNKSQSSLSTSTNPSGKNNSSKNNSSKNNSSKNNGSKNNGSDNGKSGKNNNGNGNGNGKK